MGSMPRLLQHTSLCCCSAVAAEVHGCLLLSQDMQAYFYHHQLVAYPSLLQVTQYQANAAELCTLAAQG